MKIEISESTFARLQATARPLIDSVDDVIVRLLDTHATKGTKPMNASSVSDPHDLQSEIRELRGFQRELWELVIAKVPTTRFTLRDVYARKQPLVALRPHVKEIDASIRAGLEKLRDRGLIEFVDNQGTYRRLA